MLRVCSNRAGCTKAIELHTLRLRHGTHRLLQRVRVKVLAHFHQGVQGSVENLQAVIGNRVVLMDGELPEAGAGSQALRQLELEVLKT
ncbi:hypothetical protein D3C79_976860 [compost metagenome]